MNAHTVTLLCVGLFLGFAVTICVFVLIAAALRSSAIADEAGVAKK